MCSFPNFFKKEEIMKTKKTYVIPSAEVQNMEPEGLMITTSVIVTNEETDDDARMSRRRQSIWGERPNQ